MESDGVTQQESKEVGQPQRVLVVRDIVGALDKAVERLGDVRWVEHILRSWAVEGKATPTGQLLTLEAVEAAIKARLQVPELPAAVVRADEGSCKRVPTTPAAKLAQELAQLTAKRPRVSMEEARQARLKQEAHVRELSKARLGEVLAEISGHMEEIVRRTGPDALARWKAAPVDSCCRELYSRLVHAVQEPEVLVPSELCGELLPHQVEGLEWLASLYVNGLHGILADEMGLGKTIQTITLLLYLQERKGNVGPHLVVAPKSTLANWRGEFERFAPSYRVHVLTGDQEDRQAGLQALREDISQGQPTACVTNYEQVHRNDWLKKNKWQVVVVDEGHRLKNPETLLHNTMAQMRCRMRLLLTGTPLQNNVSELWALLHYLLPELFTCMVDFKAWFARPFKGIPGLNEFEVQLEPEQEQMVVARMHALLSPFLLQRLKSEVLADSLPLRVEATVRVPLSAWQLAAYKDLERRTIRLLDDGGSVTSEQVNNALMQLRKIALHPYLFQEEFSLDDGLFRTSGKLEALDRLLPKLRRFGHKVLIFSQFTGILDILEAYLGWRSITCVRLDGQVSHEQRCVRIERFGADPAVGVFLLSARAGGLGLNLQAADTVVLFDLDWNPQADKQAVARVHRMGQTREVRVLRLVTDSAVERHMEQRCREKLELERKIMGAGMFRRQATVEMRSQALRTVLGLGSAEVAPGTQEGAVSDLTSPEELNVLLARGEEELSAYRKMDAALLPKAAEGDTAERLVQNGRLMTSEEVPKGFAGPCESRD